MEMEQMIDKYFRAGRLPHIWCPGCGNGIVTGAIVKAIDKLALAKDDIAVVSGIGCSSRASGYLDFNTVHSAHGRALPFATGIKLSEPRLKVIVITGDGDATAIGGNHFIHAARRNIDLTVVVYNNNIYGMTGGQMAPTTLVGQVTATSPAGRRQELAGAPIRLSEMLATLDGARYIARVSVNSPGNISKAKAAIKAAFAVQLRGEGFAMVEVLSTCPTNWGKSPLEAKKWLNENMLPQFPLGVYKDTTGGVLK